MQAKKIPLRASRTGGMPAGPFREDGLKSGPGAAPGRKIVGVSIRVGAGPKTGRNDGSRTAWQRPGVWERTGGEYWTRAPLRRSWVPSGTGSGHGPAPARSRRPEQARFNGRQDNTAPPTGRHGPCGLRCIPAGSVNYSCESNVIINFYFRDVL